MMNGIGDQPSLQTRAYLDKTLQLTKLYNPQQKEKGEKKKLLFLPMAQFSCWFIDGMSELENFSTSQKYLVKCPKSFFKVQTIWSFTPFVVLEQRVDGTHIGHPRSMRSNHNSFWHNSFGSRKAFAQNWSATSFQGEQPHSTLKRWNMRCK